VEGGEGPPAGHLLDQAPVLLLRAVAPGHAVGPGESGALIHPLQERGRAGGGGHGAVIAWAAGGGN
jgi:hypothetical protein